MSDAIDKLVSLIEEWEDLTTQELSVLALRTAALISYVDSVPNEIIKALAEIENLESKARSQSVYIVVKYLRSLIRMPLT